AAKRAAVDMVERIRAALKSDLETLSWMTPPTRTAAIRKLDSMALRVGYPDRWRDYGALAIDRGPYARNVMRGRVFEQRRQLDMTAGLGAPPEWTIPPQTVNASYNPSWTPPPVPAEILQPPYFEVSWPASVNYGATGATTVGHEMVHGFDDEGARFD